MEILLNVLQGSYAYLLVFQILVITGLVLALIWLIAKKTQEAHALASPSTNVSAVPATVIKADPAQEVRIGELEAKLTALEEENKGLKTASGDARSLKEKVKYLESKLLEYEILQEEIGTLSALKLENEHLKQELMQAKDGRSAPPAFVAPAPAPAPVPAAPVRAEVPAPEMDAGALIFDAPPPSAQSETMKSGEAAAAGLENLLAQIDDIAGPPDKS